jgi:hypothetical protein
MRHTTFDEVMAGTVRFGRGSLPMRLELGADLPEVLRPWGDTEGALRGRVLVPGWADDAAATGTLRVAPLAARRIRYRLTFTTAEGRRVHLDGWKSISYRRPVRSMTYLPATLTDDEGRVIGEARLHFDVRHDLAGFLAGLRLRRGPDGAGRVEDLLGSRWRGQPGRLEVWYTTLTDPATGTGVWLHHELVAPADGAPAYAHGWTAVFPPGERPVLARFGPHPWTPTERTARDAVRGSDQDHEGSTSSPPQPAQESGQASSADVSVVYRVPGVRMSAERLSGRAGEVSWDLAMSGGGEPLFTFPRWAWRRELLPAAQVVPAPSAVFDGTVRFGERVLEVRGAPGAGARIYGHGNADRWAWLHADLGGGDVCEVVAAVSTRRGLDRLPPLPFVRLRVGGRDWPAGGGLLSAARMRARIALPDWTVSGRSGDRMIRIEVTQPPAETLAVDYADPDGSPAVCHNTERADAVITLLRRSGRRWDVERRWRLEGTAHAEVGLR